MPGWGVGLLVGLGIALGLVPLLRLLALRGGWIDRPASHKAHARPTALLGGVGVYVAFMLGMLASGGLAGLARQGALLGGATLGFVLAALSLQVIPPAASGAAVAVIPLLGLIVPVLDTLLVTVSRLRQGRNPVTAPGTDHVGHRLLRGGAGSYEALAILYSVAIAGAVVAQWASR